MRKSEVILLFLLAVLPFNRAFSAETQRIEFRSPALQINKMMTVIVPAGYPADTNRFYPVVYLLNGFSGNDQQIPKGTPLAQWVDQYGIIAVCPDGGSNSWYFDSPIHPENQYETFIWRDVVGYVDSHFRTLGGRNARGIAGLSMGGHGAMYIGFRHPDLFGAVAAMSGGLDIRPFPDGWDIKHWLGDSKEHPENWESHTVINLLDQVKPGRQRIYFDCGTNDFFLKVNRAVDQKMTRLGIAHTYREFPGAHNMDYWKGAMGRDMEFFNECFSR